MTILDPYLEEAYASFNETDHYLITAELDHPGFANVVRIVTGVNPPDGDHSIPIKLPVMVGGQMQQVDHIACAFDVTRPGHDEDGPTEGKAILDGASGYLYPYLKDGLGYSTPVSVIIRVYRWSPVMGVAAGLAAIQGPSEELTDLQLTDVTLDEVRAEGTLRYEDGRQINFPTGDDAYFDRNRYPGIFNR